jgi:signal-transduction protein with cAMP-binding, CBS, and nucleotidyltransferase domain
VMYVIRKGAVEVRVEDVILDVLGEGECFGHSSLLANEGPIATVVAHQDMSVTSCLGGPPLRCSSLTPAATMSTA